MDNECLHFSIFYKVHSAIERMIKNDKENVATNLD